MPATRTPLTGQARFARLGPSILLIAAIGAFAWSQVPTAAQDTSATPTPPSATPAADAPRLELEFQELNDSGVSGTATLYESGDRTIVELDLADTGDNHPAHIHAGTCDAIEPEPDYPLVNVGRDGQSTSVVDARLDDLIAGDFVIDLHLSPNELGTLIVCAEIEGEPEIPSGMGTPGASPTATAAATEAATETPRPPATETPAPTATASPTEALTETPEPEDTSGTPEPTAVSTEVGVGDAIGSADGTGGAGNDSGEAASVPLPGVADSDMAGTAVLTAIDDDTTRISITLDDDAATSDAILHLHDGTCDAPGEMTIDLDPFDADGVSETDVDLSLDALLTDGYFINVHRSETDYDTWLVCGELSDATVGVAMSTETPVTGAGGSDTDQTPIADVTPAPEDETPIADATTAPRDETPIAGATIPPTPERQAAPTAEPTVVAAAVPTTPMGDGTSGDMDISGKGSPLQAVGDGTSGDIAASGKGSPVQAAGDGTSGDVAASGKGSPVQAMDDGTSGDVAASGEGAPIEQTTGLPRTAGTGPVRTADQTAIDRAALINGALAFLFLTAGIGVRRADLRRSRVIATTPSRHPSRWTLPDI